MAGYVPTSDWKRNKLRERLLTKGPFPELIDFSRPFVVVSAKAMREGMGTYRPHVPLEMKRAAGWPARHQPGLLLDSLDDLLPIQATPEERERFDRGEPILVRMSVCGMRAEQPSGGQPTDDIEKRIKNAFAVNVFVIFERLRPMATGLNHPIDAGSVFPAVYAGNFDPRLMFHWLASVKSFGFVRDMGRIARGQSAPLSPAQFVERIESSRKHLEEKPEMFSDRAHPELMSGREFLLHAFGLCEDQCGHYLPR